MNDIGVSWRLVWEEDVARTSATVPLPLGPIDILEVGKIVTVHIRFGWMKLIPLLHTRGCCRIRLSRNSRGEFDRIGHCLSQDSSRLINRADLAIILPRCLDPID